MVDPPDARGDPVGEDDVDGVVAAREEQRQHARHRRAERQPVQQEPPPGRICGERDDIVQRRRSPSPKASRFSRNLGGVEGNHL